MDNLVQKGNGYFLTSQVLMNDISKPTLAQYVITRNMKRVSKGVYIAPDTWPDKLYQLCLSNSCIVFSHESALYLHGLLEREPKNISVTVKAGYNATHLRNKGVKVYQVKPEVANLGMVEMKTIFGNTVKAYDKERTICDILRYKDLMDVQIFRYAMKEYMSDGQKNLNHLMAYAKKFQIESILRVYTEIML